MSKTSKKLQKQVLIKQRGVSIKKLTDKYRWALAKWDSKTYQLSFVDSGGIYRIDIYLSTFTVGLLPIGTGSQMKWFKEIDYAMIEDILKSPAKYEIM